MTQTVNYSARAFLDFVLYGYGGDQGSINFKFLELEPRHFSTLLCVICTIHVVVTKLNYARFAGFLRLLSATSVENPYVGAHNTSSHVRKI
jgi:hypothetical protein